MACGDLDRGLDLFGRCARVQRSAQMRVELLRRVEPNEHAYNAELAQLQIETRPTQDFAIAFLQHPSFHVGVQLRDVLAQLTVLTRIHRLTDLLAPRLSFLTIVRPWLRGRYIPRTLAPHRKRLQSDRIPDEQVALQQRIFRFANVSL